MAFLDKIKDIFNQGPDNWYDRLKPNLILTSPKGKKFNAKWLEDKMTLEKNVGLYNLPKSKGTIAHDLGNKSLSFPTLPFWFDGDDCDIISMALVSAMKETGTWKVDHPLRGLFVLQPLKVDVTTAPIKSGNIIEVVSEWMEPIDEKTGKTGRELAGIVDSLGTDLNDGMLDRIMNSINDGSEAFNNTTKRITTGIQNLADFSLAPLVASVDATNSIFMSTQNAINDIKLATVFQVEQLVGQIQDLIQIPIASNKDLKSRKSAYDEFAINTSSLKSNTKKDPYTKNANLFIELALASTLIAQTQVIITTPFKALDSNDQNVIGITSRVDVINIIDDLKDLYASIIETMDETQELYSSFTIEKQYHSFSEVYTTLALLISSAVSYLLVVIFDLSIERTIVLTKPRNPIDIAITEYGGLGDNDYFLDLLIESNQLIGDELLLVPAGRSIKIYA